MSYAEYLQEKQLGRPAAAALGDSEIARLVHSLSLPPDMRDTAVATLHRNGIFTVEDWHLCKKEPLVGEGVPARVRVSLNQARRSMEPLEVAKGDPGDQEDAEQNRIITQFEQWLREGKTNMAIVKVGAQCCAFLASDFFFRCP
jgi:hypothetical protein